MLARSLAINGRNMSGSFALTRTFETEGRFIDTHETKPLNPEDRFSLLEGLRPLRDIKKLRIEGCELRDDSAEIIAEIIANNPQLEELKLLDNFIGPDGLELMANAAKDHPNLRYVNVAHNMLKGAEAGEAAALFLQNAPHLEHFNITRNMLGSEGCRILAEGLPKATQLRELYAAGIDGAPQGLESLVLAAGNHPRLNLANLSSHTAADPLPESQSGIILSRLSAGTNPHLIRFSPTTEQTDALCEKNEARINHTAHLLTEDLASLNYAQLSTLHLLFPTIEKRIHIIAPPLNTSVKSQEFMHEEFPQFMANLPQLPQDGNADALFTPNNKGYAPLDNPALWDDPQAVLDFLQQAGQPLDDAFLARRTPRGVSLLESAAASTVFDTMLNALNQQNVHLQDSELMAENGKPNPLFSQLIERGIAHRLFTYSNWNDSKSVFGVQQCLQQLPPEQQAVVPRYQIVEHVKEQHEDKALGR